MCAPECGMAFPRATIMTSGPLWTEQHAATTCISNSVNARYITLPKLTRTQEPPVTRLHRAQHEAVYFCIQLAGTGPGNMWICTSGIACHQGVIL